MNKADRIAIIFFVIGVALFGVAFTKIEEENMWFQMGGISWVISYFSVIVDNFIRKVPISSRRGTLRYKDKLIRYEDKPIRYLLFYVLMSIFGIFPLAIIFLSMIAS